LEKLAESLLVYGPLGVISCASLFIAVFKDRQLTKERQEFLAKLEELNHKHQEEMQSLEERYITKAETWMTKYHEISVAQASVLEALTKKHSG